MHSLETLLIPTPPDFADLLGYRGSGNYLALWWAWGDLQASDGRSSGNTLADWSVFLTWERVYAVSAALSRYQYAAYPEAGEDLPDHALILDIPRNTWLAGAYENVQTFIKQHAPPASDLTEGMSDLDRKRFESWGIINQDNLHKMAESLFQKPTTEQIACHLSDRHEAIRIVTEWVKKQPLYDGLVIVHYDLETDHSDDDYDP